ncbi:MAG: VOC family protein [Pseudomonadota bacterium]
MQGDFVWVDLSTYDLSTAKADYAAFFGWSFQNSSGYHFASNAAEPVAAIFEMPARLAEMEMPSFWMSYIEVDDLEASVARARTHEGVVIEVEPQDFDGSARVALVRDPAGAGFTLYEGPEIGLSTARSRFFHHLSDMTAIERFYGDLFNWRFEKISEAPWNVYDVLKADGACVAQVEEVPEDIRGTFRYWMPCFDITDRESLADRVLARGGSRVVDLPGGRLMLADRQGAHFMIGG